MRAFERRIFHSLEAPRGGGPIEGMRFEDCDFFNCRIGSGDADSPRAVVRGVSLERCRVRSPYIGPAIFDRCHLRDLAAGDLVIAWGALFREVILEGSIFAWKINAVVEASRKESPLQRRCDEERIAFYEDVPFAIDISRARLRSFEHDGVPSRFIRRDPATQAVVSRRSLGGDWSERLRQDNRWRPYLADVGAGRMPDRVLAVPLGSRRETRERYRRDLNELRRLGMLEFD